ncbi:hypothetical protein [Dyadobacter arcticus]|uniref:TonB C-terminal domain-containing protein n=1 Tax=Dyadobacter arcticus TaxID=1078754 RepID=A0ABX0URP8_9BACT|nr:hypothetical protein [Dyadobacter arcticus]NIJ55668.1 hypothetical protein [Dyadobacter arcticus]
MNVIFLGLFLLLQRPQDKIQVQILERSGKASSEITDQLASILTYPQVLADGKGGIVVVQFYLTDGITIGRVKVFSGDFALNSDLVRQLTGKKLYQAEPGALNQYTVKLLFKPH